MREKYTFIPLFYKAWELGKNYKALRKNYKALRKNYKALSFFYKALSCSLRLEVVQGT